MADPPAEIVVLRERLARLDALADRDREARRAAIVAAAEVARFRNPDLAARLLADVEGEPDTIVAELAQAEPYMVVPTMNDLIRRAAGRWRQPSACPE